MEREKYASVSDRHNNLANSPDSVDRKLNKNPITTFVRVVNEMLARHTKIALPVVKLFAC